MALAWISVAILAAANLAWLPFSRMSFAASNISLLLTAFLQVTVIYCISCFVAARVDGDPSRAAQVLHGLAQRVGFTSQTMPFIIVFSLVGTVFAYQATSIDFPLQDHLLSQFDQALYFDWLSFLEYVNDRPILSWMLVHAYHSTGPLLLSIYLWFCFTMQEERLCELLALLAITSVGTAIGMNLLPAAGAYAYYAPAPQMFSNLSADAGMWHYEQLLALRTEAAPIFELAKTTGIVTFPSFHTILAIVTTYVVRHVPWVAVPILLLNALMIVSTLPEGGHYLVDLIAGAAIAAFAILAVRSVDQRASAHDSSSMIMGRAT